MSIDMAAEFGLVSSGAGAASDCLMLNTCRNIAVKGSCDDPGIEAAVCAQREGGGGGGRVGAKFGEVPKKDKPGREAGRSLFGGGPGGIGASKRVDQRFTGAGGAADDEAPGVSAGPSVGTYMLQLLAGITKGREYELEDKLGALGWGNVAPIHGSSSEMGSAGGGSGCSMMLPV